MGFFPYWKLEVKTQCNVMLLHKEAVKHKVIGVEKVKQDILQQRRCSPGPAAARRGKSRRATSAPSCRDPILKQKFAPLKASLNNLDF